MHVLLSFLWSQPFALATLLVCFVVSIFSRGFWTELVRANAQPTLPPLSQCCSLLVTADSCFLSFHLCTAWEHTHTLFHKYLFYCIYCAYSYMLTVGSDGGFTYSLISPPTHTIHKHWQVQCLKVMLIAIAATSAICLIHHCHFPFLLKFNLII